MSEHAPGAAAGARIRALRTDLGLSLSALAAAAGIGKGSLSELETGRRNPTLDTLYAVAGPLGVPLVALLDGPAVADDAMEALLLHSHVTPGPDGHTEEVYLLRMAPGTTRRSPAHSAGVVEQLVVLGGACRVEVGESVHVLGVGDHARWPADVPHAYVVTSDVELRAVDVISTPTPHA